MYVYLKKFEQHSSLIGHHFEQLVELLAVRSLTVRHAQCECQEIQHGRHGERAAA